VGDRANVAVYGEVGRQPVCFYTHWGGSELPTNVSHAIARRERWSDPGYLSRIIFCQMVGADDFEGTTSFGIYAGQTGDNEYPLLVVDCPNQCVRVLEPHNGDLPPHNVVVNKTIASATFEEVAADERVLKALRDSI